MKRRKIIWILVAAALWVWAALVAGAIFPEIPALLSSSPDVPDATTTFSHFARFELVLLGVLLLFVLFNHPSRKIGATTGCVAALLILKIFWLAPLLDSSFHWEYPPLSFLPVIYIVTELIKFIVLLLTSYWLYTEITAIAKVEERYRLFMASRKELKKHIASNS